MRIDRGITAAYHGIPSNDLAVYGCGFTDFARVILHVGSLGFCFGKTEGRTLIIAFFTRGWFLRLWLEQSHAQIKTTRGTFHPNGDVEYVDTIETLSCITETSRFVKAKEE